MKTKIFWSYRSYAGLIWSYTIRSYMVLYRGLIPVLYRSYTGLIPVLYGLIPVLYRSYTVLYGLVAVLYGLIWSCHIRPYKTI